MPEQENINYKRIAKAIDYIQKNFKDQPSLEEIALAVHLSPFHFQRLFSKWAGVSPKKFMQFLSVEYAKKIISSEKNTLLDVACDTGLSGTSRLHDLFVNIEGMTPGEYKNGGESLVMNYSFSESPFGNLIIASTSKGICHMIFEDDEEIALADVKLRFPNARYVRKMDDFHRGALSVFQYSRRNLDKIKLHLNGTPFQIKVWESLLKIPMGDLITYGSIAEAIKNPNATRAVGTAIGSNPVAFLIPCHRVIKSTGVIGGYMCGNTRKAAIIGWEAAKISN